MSTEWMMFRAALSPKNGPREKYMQSTLRMHLMSVEHFGQSSGYVEQRTTSTQEEETHFYVTCLESGDGKPIRVNTLEDGMNLLLLLINQRGNQNAN